MHYAIINARNILVVGPRMLGGQTEDEYQYHVSRSRRFSLFQQLGVKQLVYLKGDKNIERRLFSACHACVCVLPKVVVNETARKKLCNQCGVGGC